jgi:hypothetical protein
LNTAMDTFYHTNDIFKAWNTAAKVSNKNCFILPFWLLVGCDILKLIR